LKQCGKVVPVAPVEIAVGPNRRSRKLVPMLAVNAPHNAVPAACDEESLLAADGKSAEHEGSRSGWCCRVLSLSALFAYVMCYYAHRYSGRMAEGEDTGGGWAGDFMLFAVAVSFIASSHFVISDPYVVFYWGTAIAYGLGGLGHFLEGSDSASMTVGYYISMTLAFGGDAIRAGWGYALPESPAVTAQRVFSLVVYAALCVFALWNLKLVLTLDMPTEDLAASLAGKMYKATQIMMGVVEACGSIVWYDATRHNPQGKSLRLVATATNVSAWTVVKIMPLMFAREGISTTVAHRLSHYCQYVIMWIMLTLTTRFYVNGTAQQQLGAGAGTAA